MTLIYIIILGLLFGSFLNVCIYRLPRDESIIRPRSHCTSCDKTLTVTELIPVISWIIQLGKCKSCSAKFSFRYPFVEMVTSGIFVFCYQYFYVLKGGDYSSGLAFVLYLMTLLVITYIDLDYMLILDVVSIPAIAVSLIWSLAGHVPLEPTGPVKQLWMSIQGLLVGGGLLWSVYFLGALYYRQDAMGLGDVKLAMFMGAFLGRTYVLYAILIGVMVGGILSLLMILTGFKKRKDYIPFGPFLAFGAAVAPFYGEAFYNMMRYWDISDFK